MPIIRSSTISKTAANNVGPHAQRIPKKNVPENVTHYEEKRKMSNNNLSNRSSAGSYGSETKVKTSFKLTKSVDGGAVYFKQDGERFDTKETLKLQCSTDYIVKLEISPVMQLASIKFAGVEYSFELLNDPENDSKAVYQFVWSTTGIDATLSRHRANVPCTIKYKNFKELDFKIQVKFYGNEDVKHITWGQALNAVVVENTVGRGSYNSTADSIRFV